MDANRVPQRKRWLLVSAGLILALAALLSLLVAFSASATAQPATPWAQGPTDVSTTPPGPESDRFWQQPSQPRPPVVPLPPLAPRPTGPDKGFDEIAGEFPAARARIRVNQDHDWVDGRTSSNATVWITLTDRLGAVKGTNSTTERGDGWFGGVNVYDGGQAVDIVPTDVVLVASSDGSVRSATVLTMTGLVDADANTISGVIEGGIFPARVRGEVWTDDGPNVFAMTDSAGHYHIDFSPFDLLANTDIFLLYYEPDGDAIGIVRRGFSLRVNYGHDWVETYYEAGHAIWITLTNSSGVVKATSRGTTAAMPEWGGSPGFATWKAQWSPIQPDIVPGDWVYGTLSNGLTNIVRVGTITGNLDTAQDTINGTITAAWFTETLDARCEVWAPNGPPGIEFTVAPNGGSYRCDFRTVGWDLLPGQDVVVIYYEPDGDEVINVFREPAPDLAVDKYGWGQPAPGGNYVYRINYHNHGDGLAHNVLITDALPAGMTYVADTSGFPHALDGNSVIWDVGSLAGNTHSFFDVFVAVDDGLTPGTPVTNTVQIGTPDHDTDPGNNYHEWSVEVSANDTHLNVGKWAWTGDPAPDTEFVYGVNVCNNGPTASSQVTITDTLHPSTTLQSWWGQHAGWTEVASSDNLLVVSRPSLPGWWCSQVYLRVRLDAAAELGMSISNTAIIAASNDLESHDNETTWWGGVSAPHTNIYLARDWTSGQLVPGGTIAYEMRYRNDGNVPVNNVLITDTLPVNTTFIRSWSWNEYGEQPVTPTVVTADYVVWNIGTLDNGYGGPLAIALKIDGDASPGTVLTNTVEISPQPMEDRYDDNVIAWVDLLNNRGPNLRVDKQNYNWNGQGQIQYEVRVKNLGTERLEDIWISDIYPPSTTYESWWVNHGPWITGTHDAPNRLLIFWVQGLNPGETASIGFRVDLDGAVVGRPGLLFTNTLDAPIPGDVYPADNHDAVVAASGPDLSIEKWLSGGVPKPGELLTYTLHFANVSQAWGTAGDVWITEKLPARLEYVSTAQRFCGTTYLCLRDPNYNDGTTIIWNYGQMCNGCWNDFLVTVRVASTARGGEVLTNTASIASVNPDDVEPYSDNNRSAYAVTVVAAYKVYLPTLLKK